MEHKVPGTFRPNRPRQKVLVSGVRACDGNGLVLCEGGTREARTAHGFGGVGPKAGFSKRPPMEARLALMAAIAAPWKKFVLEQY